MAKNLTRWDPNREMVSLRDAMDRLVGESFFRPWSSLGTFFGGEGLAVEMYETDDEVVVKASVPGVEPAEIDVKELVGNVLTIKGERKEEKKEEKASYIYLERTIGTFPSFCDITYRGRCGQGQGRVRARGADSGPAQVRDRQAQVHQHYDQVTRCPSFGYRESSGHRCPLLQSSTTPARNSASHRQRASHCVRNGAPPDRGASIASVEVGGG